MTPCPADDVLRAYLCGAVSDAEQESLAEHVDECPSCVGRLSRLDEPHDALLGALRGVCGTPMPAEPAVRALLERGLGDGPVVEVGGHVGPYLLLAKLGEGGMGAVYQARHKQLGKVFAVKVLSPGRRDAARATRFEREMKAVGRLEHPNIVRATDAGEDRGVAFLAMELIDGTDLSRLVRRDGPFPPARACELIRQAALALGHAHERGLVHRDVKPSNLLLTPDGTVKLLDLGLALAAGDPVEPPTVAGDPPTVPADHTLTEAGMGLGTRDYMAPEQATAPHAVDARADVYALGATLHFLLTGHAPGKAAPPAELAGLLNRMLAAQPDERYASAAEVADAMAEYLRPAAVPARRPRYRRAAVVAVGLAAAVVVAIALTRDRTPREAAGLPVSAPEAGRLPLTEGEAKRLQQAHADHLGQQVVVKNTLGMELALIPPGEFGLYATYQVTLTKPYRMGTLEVTRGQFQQFVAANPGVLTDAEAKPRVAIATFTTIRPLADFPHPRGTPVNWRTPGWGEYRDDQPITYLTWNDADAFLTWLSAKEGRTYRLPTQAEWAWACRAGTATHFYWGHDVKQIGTYAWTRMSNVDRPQSVGQLRPNAWGLHDMLGNVSEMVQDYHRVPLPAGRATDPVNAVVGRERIVCGGGYMSLVDYSLDTLPASAADTAFTDSTRGFRVVREP